MKITNEDRRVHILNENTQVFDVIKSVTESGNQDEAFYILDLGDLVKKYDTWKKYLPRVKPFYAVKCNDSVPVLKTLAALGTGFDCASKGEIAKVISLGVDPSRIILANTVKQDTHIKYAEKVEVKTMTFDTEAELHKISKVYPKAELVIRIKCDDPEATHVMGKKFGCDHQKEAPELLKTAKILGLNVVGVSFHIGPRAKNPEWYITAIEYSKEVFDEAEKLGFNFNLLDIGGGYPGDIGTSIKGIAEIINSALDQYFPDPSIEVIAEPGRYFVASAYTLACCIHSIRKIEEKDPKTLEKRPHNMYYLNDGIFGSFMFVIRDNIQPIPQHFKGNNINLISSSLWGPTCDSWDRINPEVSLPELSVGDWLVFDNMGAYTLTLIGEFNGFTPPELHVVADGPTWDFFKDKVPFSEDQNVDKKSFFEESLIYEKIFQQKLM